MKELEPLLDRNVKLNALILSLKETQKKMVNAKEFHQEKQYAIYKKEYDALYERVLNFPFVEEYLELLENVNQYLLQVTQVIEAKINGVLN